jgi:hypothetical protein
MRTLLQDPHLRPNVIARVILGVPNKESSFGARHTYQRDGHGAVLVDLR